jgi:cell division septal protein FtsQ
MAKKKNKGKIQKWLLAIIIIMVVIGLARLTGIDEIRTIVCVNQNGETLDWSELAKDTSLAELPAKLIIVNRNSIESLIDNHPNYQIKWVKYDFPYTLSVSVIEFQPTACMMFDKHLLMMDSNGVIINSLLSDKPTGKVPLVIGLRMNGYMLVETINTIEPLQRDTLIILMKAIEVCLTQQEVKQIDISDQTNIYLQTTDGLVVRLGRIEHIEEKMKWLASDEMMVYCLDQSNGYLDLSIVNEPIFCLEDKEEGQT